MPEEFLTVPQAATDVTRSIWTPTEITYVQSWLVGKVPGFERVFKHEFMLKFRGETEMFGVVAEESASEAQIEDMAAATSEKAMIKIADTLSERGSKLKPEDLANPDYVRERRDLAGAWRDMRRHAAKRRASTSGRLYWPIA